MSTIRSASLGSYSADAIYGIVVRHFQSPGTFRAEHGSLIASAHWAAYLRFSFAPPQNLRAEALIVSWYVRLRAALAEALLCRRGWEGLLEHFLGDFYLHLFLAGLVTARADLLRSLETRHVALEEFDLMSDRQTAAEHLDSIDHPVLLLRRGLSQGRPSRMSLSSLSSVPFWLRLLAEPNKPEGHYPPLD